MLARDKKTEVRNSIITIILSSKKSDAVSHIIAMDTEFQASRFVSAIQQHAYWANVLIFAKHDFVSRLATRVLIWRV